MYYSMDKTVFFNLLNDLGCERRPFFFIIDFDMHELLVYPDNNTSSKDVLFNIRGVKNYSSTPPIPAMPLIFGKPIEFAEYQKAFEKVQQELLEGNSWLLNLTFSTSIKTNCSLMDIFYAAEAPYKILLKDRFVCFSPEPFVRIRKDRISSFPMKGTIDASLSDAENIVLNDEKETAEHITIVDLIRNDISIIAHNTRVERFRYVEKISTNTKDLFQVSSEIAGDLESGWQNRIGDILYALLPAGSVTGAPKKKTVEIIHEVEGSRRGFYTGVAGYFDGVSIDTCVLIRYIESSPDGLFYRSGGGITIHSDVQKEYQEMQDKIYVPIR